jgi:hypothetical protein
MRTAVAEESSKALLAAQEAIRRHDDLLKAAAESALAPLKALTANLDLRSITLAQLSLLAASGNDFGGVKA